MLIDDVFGELDPDRRNALMAAWPEESQKLITATHLDWLDERFGDIHRLHVEEATVGLSDGVRNVVDHEGGARCPCCGVRAGQ